MEIFGFFFMFGIVAFTLHVTTIISCWQLIRRQEDNYKTRWNASLVLLALLTCIVLSAQLVLQPQAPADRAEIWTPVGVSTLLQAITGLILWGRERTSVKSKEK